MAVRSPAKPSPIMSSQKNKNRAELRPKISAEEARRIVSAYALINLGDRLSAGEPILREGHRLQWEVPVVQSFPGQGTTGRAGTITMDATTGELLIEPNTHEQIHTNAKQLFEETFGPYEGDFPPDDHPSRWHPIHPTVEH